MPRQMGYNSHRTSQALANTSNNKYTSLRVQITLDRVTTIRLPREQRIGVASQAYRGIRRRQGIGFASAIETCFEHCHVVSLLKSPGDWLRVCD